MVSGVSGDDVNVGDRAETHTDAHVTANRSSRCPIRLDWTGSTPGDTASHSEPERAPSESPSTARRRRQYTVPARLLDYETLHTNN